MNEKWFPSKPVFDRLYYYKENELSPIYSKWDEKKHRTGIFEEAFNIWWDKEILPLFENAQVVYGLTDCVWGLNKSYRDLYQALVIKAGPIEEKKKEAEPQYLYVDLNINFNGEKLYKRVKK